MFSAKFLLAALSLAAVPSLLTLGGELASPTITACSSTINPPDGCTIISVVSASCINLTGNLSSLNKEVSWVQVPDGFVCTFFHVDITFRDRDCSNGGGSMPTTSPSWTAAPGTCLTFKVLADLRTSTIRQARLAARLFEGGGAGYSSDCRGFPARVSFNRSRVMCGPRLGLKAGALAPFWGLGLSKIPGQAAALRPSLAGPGFGLSRGFG
ncbi:hypothetical protein C8F04DRAFT_1193149 [Mycena alexandri]|uniref:Uncharacterized protein n=1 Tax=Mycena alexandri TaxID=1745969 RepID=A0AAD6SAM2_9AGAR|nr:hypothetical protein C8F04DRAFT_1193149 [Mycena alexandri]